MNTMTEETFSISGQHMKLSQFKYKLPDERIALYPAEYRDESRLLVLHKKTGEIEHRIFKEIIEYFDTLIGVNSPFRYRIIPCFSGEY
jgi:hypothetical protein